jgi:hypothetical protein
VEAGTDRAAQDWFRLMIDMGLAPGLRALGFIGAGRRFRMDLDSHSAEVLIAQSPSLKASCVRFTLTLRVLNRDEWSDQLRVRPYSSRPPQSPSGWQAPIGQLVTVGGYPLHDLWWELECGQPFESLAREVLTTLHTFGMPAICHHIRRAG